MTTIVPPFTNIKDLKMFVTHNSLKIKIVAFAIIYIIAFVRNHRF